MRKLSLLLLCFALPAFAADFPSPVVESFSLEDARLTDAVHLVSSASGIPVVCTPEAAETEVTLFFNDTTLEASLQAMCRSHGLWMNHTPEGVLIISTLEQHLASQSVYSGDYMETITVKYPSVYDVGDTLKGLFRDRLVWERPDEDDMDPVERVERAIDRMDILSDRSQFDIQDNNSSSSSRNTSSSSSRNSYSSSSGYNNANELQQMKSMDEYEGFMRELMKQRAQSGVDGAKMRALIYISALPEINTLLIRSSDRDAVQLVKQSIIDMDKPRGQVLLRVIVLAVTLDDSVSTGVEWLFAKDRHSTGFADSQIQPLKFGSSSETDYLSGIPVVSYIDNNLRVRVEALAENKNIRTLATPTLLVADNEAANVFVGEDSKFLDQITPGIVVNTDGGITTTEPSPTFEDRKIGLSLLITPRVHADRSITLRIMQERSQASPTLRSIDYGGARPVEVQDIEQEVVTSTLVAKDQSLVALGGMITESNITTESGVPILKNIPLLGALFSHHSTQQTREELMVLIHPTVLAVPGEEHEATRVLLDSLKVNLEESQDGMRFDTAVDRIFGEKNAGNGE